MGKRELLGFKVFKGMQQHTRQDIFKGMPDDKSSLSAMEDMETGRIAKVLTKGATRFKIFTED